MAFDPKQILTLYRQRAETYDRSVWLYRLAGFRVDHYRRETVAALGLSPGDTVVDLGCGTGLNFPFLQEVIGPEGHILGVDLTDAMLAAAAERIERRGWRNVSLECADLSRFEPPPEIDGALSTFAITLVREYDEVVRVAASKLRPGGRLAIFDFKWPEHWPEWLIRLAVRVNRPFGVTLDLAERHLWESVRRHLEEITFRTFYWGAAYLSVGEVPTSRSDEASAGVGSDAV